MPIDNQNAEVIAGCVDITRRTIEARPTVDAIKVIRCKDCKYYKQETKGDYFRCQVFNGAYEHGFPTEEDDFCSYGEKREH